MYSNYTILLIIALQFSCWNLKIIVYPVIFKKKISLASEVHNHNTRSASKLNFPKAKINYGKSLTLNLDQQKYGTPLMKV